MPVAAGKLRVLIATTHGPVEVLLLTEEDAAIGRCVACIGGTTETADIASAYHAFVVRPTGIIEARFGHSCYRLDVSGRIDAGSSWQLGVLAAHALLAERRLAQESDTADAVLWATGSVRAVDLTVGAVSHVPEKLANSLDRLKQERAAGRPVLVALPAANAAEVPPTLAGELAALGIETIALAHVQPLFDALAMQLPDSSGKVSVAAPVASSPMPPPTPRLAAAPRRRWIVGAVAACALLATAAATTAVLLVHKDESAAPPSPHVAAAPAPAPPVLDPDRVPYVTTQERARIRDEYMKAPDYKALATNFLQMVFVTGEPTQEAADRSAMAACEKLGVTTNNKADGACDLYAAGNIVVTRRSRPPMPPEPWFVRNPAVERPFIAAQIPLIEASIKQGIGRAYPRTARSKAFVISPNRRWSDTTGQASPDDAIRRSLERCGYVAGSACMVVAVDDTFVVPIPTLAKAVGFYRADALFGVQPNARNDVARRLAGTPNGWNAVAVGAGGNVGVAVGADSEQGAFDGAMRDCAQHDRDCRIAVLGPFLVEALAPGQNEAQAQPRQPNQLQEQASERTPPPAPQLASAPAAAAPPQVALVPDRMPFITTHDRARIRDEYMTARDHKALATSLIKIAFVSGQPTQEAADRAAIEACKKLDPQDCELYASGNVVVTRRSPPPMPAEPWLVRNPAIERPFVGAQLPMGGSDAVVKERIGNGYPRANKSRVFLISARGEWYYTPAHSSAEEATRLGLERCGHKASSPCMVIAVDDTFVVPIPTLAKVVGLYRPDALFGVKPEEREGVARRLAASPNSWNGVAVGTGGIVGIAVGAGSEQSALESALADCATHGGRECRIAVLGPFMVEATRRIEAQNQPPTQEPRQGVAPGQGQSQFPGQTQEEKAPVNP